MPGLVLRAFSAISFMLISISYGYLQNSATLGVMALLGSTQQPSSHRISTLPYSVVISLIWFCV